jgi:hypothetical protein
MSEAVSTRGPAWLRGVLAALALAAAAGSAAQSYPTRSIRLIIPAGPGGGADTISRMVGQALSAALEQPVVMDNRPGAGTMLASELTAKSPPDGYTLLMATNSHAINAGIHKNLRYDPVNDSEVGRCPRKARFPGCGGVGGHAGSVRGGAQERHREMGQGHVRSQAADQLGAVTAI